MTDKLNREWTLDTRTTEYEGFYRIDKLQFRHTQHRGGWTRTLDRELFVRGHVVSVLPHDPVTDQIALIEQFRLGAMHQAPDPWLLEVIAGMVEEGETPTGVARREAQEEAGLCVENLQLISRYLASPGATTEEVFVYYATADLSQARTGELFGLAEEDEDIRLRIVPANEAIGMLETRELRNAISIIAMQWFQRQREQGIL